MRILKRRQGNYKEKLPFKFFKCGRIGHFASKCTYEKWESESEEELECQESTGKNQLNKDANKNKL